MCKGPRVGVQRLLCVCCVVMAAVFLTAARLHAQTTIADVFGSSVENTITEVFGSPGTYIWTAPAGVTSATFDVSGAQGGAGGNTLGPPVPGGLGGRTRATFVVVPGTTYQINVGGSGGAGSSGLGSSSAQGGGGGGASDVRLSPFTLNERIIVAGGGGGGSTGTIFGFDARGGNGSGANGDAGQDGALTTGGAGGTDTAGGAAGAPLRTGGSQGLSGSAGQGGAGGADSGSRGGFNGGGNGGNAFQGGGGGGGGGYFGGGGGGSVPPPVIGTGGGGGGGSGFGPAGATFETGVRLGDGRVTITYTVTPTLSTNASAGVAFGGSISDTATITDGSSPTGTLTFRLYGPNDATCAGAPVFTNTKTVSGNGSYVSSSFTPTATGVYRWTASYGGSGANNAVAGACNAPNESVTIGKASQTIGAIAAPVAMTYHDAPFPASAAATSSLLVTLSSTTTGVCMVSGSIVTIVSAGTCTLAANQAGDGNYNPAPQVTQNIEIAKATQTIAFGALGTRLLGTVPFAVSATATSRLPVTFASQTRGVCAVNTGTVTLLAPGTCTIAAAQAGDGKYHAADPATRSFEVAANCAGLSLQPGSLRTTLAGLPYTQGFTIANGTAPFSFTLEGALPAGLTFDNGALSGTPSGRGVFPITVTASDAHACQVSASFRVSISPERRLIAGEGDGGSTVRAFTRAGATPVGQFDALSPAFSGGVSVAQGDVNGDGIVDVIAGAGPGGAPSIGVFDGATHAPLASFVAFAPSFTGGVEVAAGDVTGDGIAEVLATAGCGGPNVVRAFNGITGALVREYPAPSGSCGLHLAAGDVNGDGIADPVVGARGGSSPVVAVLDGFTGATLRQFHAYIDSFRGGVYVAAGDITGDGFADIVTGAGPGGGPHVRAFDGRTGAEISGPLASFFAYHAAFPGGVRVAAGDLNGDGRAELITAAGPGGGPHVRVFDGATGSEMLGLFAFDPAFRGGVFVAAPPSFARMAVDSPTAGATGGSVRIAGWALKQIAIDTPGVNLMNAWALPVGGGAPIFVGGALVNGERADVANVFGGEFLTSGFDVTATLAPGTYDLVVFVRNSRSLIFDQLRIVRIVVN